MNVHRLLITSCLISMKYVEDSPISNDSMGLLGGLSTKELNEFEIKFCKLINYDLYVPDSILEFYLRKLLWIIEDN